MANIEFYKKHLNLSSSEEILEYLCDTSIETNRTYDFFVDWDKVQRNRDELKHETALLNSLANSTKPKDDLSELIRRYPEVVRAIPILLAYREGIVRVLDAMEPVYTYKHINFTPRLLTSDEVSEIVDFTDKTGLLPILCSMQSTSDYLLGIEAGLDSNARKNRSGTFLECLVVEMMDKMGLSEDFIRLEQKTFSYVSSKHRIGVPEQLVNKKCDFVFLHNNRGTNVETNFYEGTGSKPPAIVGEYTDRNRLLKDKGWKFIWLTDGGGWKKMKNPLLEGIKGIDYIINVEMLRNGVLGKILTE